MQAADDTPSAPPAAPSPSGNPVSGGENAPEPPRAAGEPQRFTADEMREIRSKPRVKEVLDTFRGRIEAVKRTNPSDGE